MTVLLGRCGGGRLLAAVDHLDRGRRRAVEGRGDQLLDLLSNFSLGLVEQVGDQREILADVEHRLVQDFLDLDEALGR